MQPGTEIDIEDYNLTPFKNRFLAMGYKTGKNQWWMYLAGICAAFLGYGIFQMIILFPLWNKASQLGISNAEIEKNPAVLFNPDILEMNRSLMFALQMGMFVFALLFLWVVVKIVHQKKLKHIITGFNNIRWNRYFFAFGVWALLLIAYIIMAYFAAPDEVVFRFEPGKFTLLLLVAIIFIPVQTATEEIILRGYLLQGSAISFKNGFLPLIITSVLFGLLHSSNPEVKVHGLLVMMPYYILFGAFLGMLTLLDEGTELAMGIHCANNLCSSLLICSKNSVLQTDAVFYTTHENPGGEFLAWVIMASICFFILHKKYKLSNWQLLLR